MRMIVMALLTSGAVSAAQDKVATLIVDDAHLQMEIERPAGSAPQDYQIAPAVEIVLDASKYHFRLPEGVRVEDLNCIQVALGKNEQYTMNLPKQVRSYRVGPPTLRANAPEMPRFDGFRHGHEGVIAIGVCKPTTFTVVWVGMLRVFDPRQGK